MIKRCSKKLFNYLKMNDDTLFRKALIKNVLLLPGEIFFRDEERSDPTQQKNPTIVHEYQNHLTDITNYVNLVKSRVNPLIFAGLRYLPSPAGYYALARYPHTNYVEREGVIGVDCFDFEYERLLNVIKLLDVTKMVPTSGTDPIVGMIIKEISDLWGGDIDTYLPRGANYIVFKTMPQEVMLSTSISRVRQGELPVVTFTTNKDQNFILYALQRSEIFGASLISFVKEETHNRVVIAIGSLLQYRRFLDSLNTISIQEDQNNGLVVGEIREKEMPVEFQIDSTLNDDFDEDSLAVGTIQAWYGEKRTYPEEGYKLWSPWAETFFREMGALSIVPFRKK